MSAQPGKKKSRKGCKRCKARRVKCDEQTPCSNCVRRHEECSLLEPTPSGSSDSTGGGLATNNEEWVQDLELMHHYSTSTACRQFGIHDSKVEIWRDYIPQQALEHTFLMHGILAFSALHLAYQHPHAQMRYLQLCDKHQTIAVKTFRAVLSSDIHEDQAEALFALSAIISISSMARSCVAVSQVGALNMDEVAEMFFLTHGIRGVIHVHHERVKHGPMAEMFEHRRRPEGMELALPQPIASQFAAIRLMFIDYGLDPEALEHCQTALSQLEDVYQDLIFMGTCGDTETGQVFRWKALVSMDYIRLVQARSPPALIILAYYAGATTAIRKAWYAENFAEYTLRGISLELPESMQHWLIWPQQQLQERMAVLGTETWKSEEFATKPLV